MKFKQLTIHNIASIADATIHFDKKPLEGESLFLICGETGSGKTTILDAICLALYKTTPRIEQSKSEKYIDESLQVLNKGENEGIQVSDPRQYLRRGTNEGHVELTFDGNAGEACVARVAFGIVERTNNLKEVEWSLNVDGTTLKNNRDIKEKIKEVVGFDFEQFCRTTMLAQGEFTRFLKSDEKEKSKILEKLTGTDIYSEIGKRIFEITQSKKAEVEKADVALKSISLRTDEELQQLEATKEGYEGECARLKKQKKDAEDKKAWLEAEDKYVNEERDALAKLAEWKTKSEEDQVVEDRKTVAQWRRTEKERQAVVVLAKLQQQEKDNLSENQRLEQTYMRLISGELFRSNEIEGKQKEMTTLTEQLESEQPYAAMYAEGLWIVAKLQQHLADADKAKEYADKANEEKGKLPEKEQAWQSCKEAWGQAGEVLKEKEGLVKAKQEELKQLDPDQLYQELQQVSELVQQYVDAENKVKLQQQATKEWEEAAKRVGELQQKIEEKTTKLEALRPEIRKAQEAFDEAKALYEKTKLSVGDYAKALRHELHEGDVCPVCGNKVANVEHDDAFEQALKPAYDLFKAKEQEYNALVDAEKTLEAEIKSLNDSVETARADEKRKADALRDANEAMTSVCAKLQIDANAENLPVLIAEKKAAKDSELKGLKEKMEIVQSKQKEVDGLRGEKDAAALAEKEAKKAADEAEKVFSALKASIKNFEDLAAQKQKDSEQALTDVSDKVTYPEWRADIGQTIARLTKDAERFARWQRQKQELEAQVRNMLEAQQHARTTCSQVKRLFPTWSESKEAQQVADLDGAWGQLLTEASKLHESMSNTQEGIQENQNVIDSFLGAENEIDLARLMFLAKLSHALIDEKESSIKDIDRCLQTAQGALEQIRKNHQAHVDSKPVLTEDDTLERLVLQIKDCETSLTDLAQKIGEIKAQVSANEQNREESNKKRQAFEAAEKEWLKWDSLRVLFGDKEGKVFRVIAQSYVLRELLAHANAFLHDFSDRYEMVCQNNLTILVRDLYYGGVARPVDLVSGGESFIVSLALALGLSSLNRNSLSADILFIDEGFGTLDPNVLELVLNTLGRLRVLGDRRVGIISHVEALERIPVKIIVKKVDNTTSEIVMDS